MSEQVETINIHPVTSEFGEVNFHLWQKVDGWYSCRSGEYQGNYSESDDLGPYPTREAALEAQQDDFDAAMRDDAKYKEL